MDIVDCREIDDAALAERFLAAFSALGAGTGLLIISHDKPVRLLELLQDHFPSQFEWYALIDGPTEWLVAAAKRAQQAPGKRKVTEFMTADHERIHQLLAELEHAADNNDHARIIDLTKHLETGLRRHFEMEEELLFPEISRRLGTPRGPAAVLTGQHSLIIRMVAALHERAQAAADVKDAVGELAQTLTHHSQMEEGVLYASCDLLMNDDQRDELVKACQRL